ncbi:hypothetical protein [Haloferula rosea]|uniref:Nucleotidyltransferase family protein n=1 Tax=Haloferula rosea TaxID=490093 RepID=A0A934RF52_9BACT|nr:hypothetical protein [Haloferula rosea]MBK1828493.1 hypothetical protein [Haloferula rosea]
MEPPDWKQCSEAELWHYVAWHLEGAEIRSVLVGGAVVAIYTEGLYRSGDLDLIADSFDFEALKGVLSSLGFVPSKSRYFKHPECRHLFLEFPPGPVEIGEEFPVVPDELEVHGRALQLLSPTDCVKDRLAGYIHWKSRANFDQAVLVCRRQSQRVQFEIIRRWCQAEGAIAVYEELRQALQDS